MLEATPPAKASKQRLRWWKGPLLLVGVAVLALLGVEVTRQIMIAVECGKLAAARERLDKTVLHGKSIREFYESRAKPHGRNGWAKLLDVQRQSDHIERYLEFMSRNGGDKRSTWMVEEALINHGMVDGKFAPASDIEVQGSIYSTQTLIAPLQSLLPYESIVVVPIAGSEDDDTVGVAMLSRLNIWSSMLARVEAQLRVGDKTGAASDLLLITQVDSLFCAPAHIFDAYVQLRCHTMVWEKIADLAGRGVLDASTLAALLLTPAPDSAMLLQALEAQTAADFFFLEWNAGLQGDPWFDWLYQKNQLVETEYSGDYTLRRHPFLSWQVRRDFLPSETYLLDCLELARSRGAAITAKDLDLPVPKKSRDEVTDSFIGKTMCTKFLSLRLSLELIHQCRAVAHLRLAEFTAGSLREGHPALATSAPPDSWVDVKFDAGKCVVTLSYAKLIDFDGGGRWDSEADFRKTHPAIVLAPSKN